jgi:hypothetical protein
MWMLFNGLNVKCKYSSYPTIYLVLFVSIKTSVEID